MITGQPMQAIPAIRSKFDDAEEAVKRLSDEIKRMERRQRKYRWQNAVRCGKGR